LERATTRSYIFMDADYVRNRDRDGAPTKAFEPSFFVWATVMSRPAKDRAIVDAGLKALAFDSGPPTVWDEPAATYERASDEHGRLAVTSASNRLRIGARSASRPAIATRPSTSTTGVSASAATASRRSGQPPPAARCIDATRLAISRKAYSRYFFAVPSPNFAAMETPLSGANNCYPAQNSNAA
jgi:Putative serine dehydratase domain